MNRRLLFAALAALTLACAKPDPAAGAAKAADAVEAAVKVETRPVEHENMPRFLTLTGSVLADKQSDVAANVSGRIIGTYVERGKVVKTGDVIAIVDSKAAGFSAAAAVAQAQAAETQVDLAKQDCARADTLFSQGAIPKAEHDRLKSQCTAQLFQANAARANSELAGKLAGDTVIRAPIDGVVSERFINVGEFVQPATRVATVVNINPVRVSISVPEFAVGQVKLGQTLEVNVSAWPDRKFPAEIKFVSPALRATTRDLIVEASAKNDDGALKPGMFATVNLLIGEAVQPTVPLSAIKTDGTTRRLFVAKDGRAVEMVVSLGVTREGRVAVLEPLEKGTSVVVSPPPGLRDGSALQ